MGVELVEHLADVGFDCIPARHKEFGRESIGARGYSMGERLDRSPDFFLRERQLELLEIKGAVVNLLQVEGEITGSWSAKKRGEVVVCRLGHIPLIGDRRTLGYIIL